MKKKYDGEARGSLGMNGLPLVYTGQAAAVEE